MVEGKIDVKTYKSYSGQFVTDPDNQLTLNVLFELIQEFPSNILPLLVVLFAFSCTLAGCVRRRRRSASAHVVYVGDAFEGARKGKILVAIT